MRTPGSLIPALLVLAVACKGTEPVPRVVPAAIALTKGDNQVALVGQPVRDTVKFRVTQADNTPAPGVTVSFAVSAGGGTVASSSAVTNAQGEATLPAWTMGSAEIENRVVATVETFTATAKAQATVSLFNIEIVYLATPTATQQAAFDRARFKWRSIIQSELNDIPLNTSDPNTPCGKASYTGTVDDVVIFADLDSIDGRGKVLGSAGPCLVRQTVGGVVTFVIAGTMKFDTADLQALEDNGQLNNVILHEMGHVLGIGSLWRTKSLLDTSTVVGDPIFTGAQAMSAYTSAGGGGCGCRIVPVENTGGAGTRHSHWRENPSAVGKADGLRNELMTGFLNAGSNPLSLITVNSLRDMGFSVDTSKADPYTAPLAFMALNSDETASVSETRPAIRLNEAEPDTDLRSVDEHGKLARILRRSSRKQ